MTQGQAKRSRERRTAVAAVAWSLCVLVSAAGLGCGEPASPPRVHDATGFLADADRVALDERLELLHRESGIDAQFSFIDGAPDSDLDGRAARDFEMLGIGGQGGEGRGLLLVYDVPSRRLRIEVGYALEGYFPDAFVGYLIGENAHHLFDAGDPAQALLLTIRMLEHRIRIANLGGSFDPTFVRALRSARFGSGGAGATDGGGAGPNEPGSVRAMSSAWRARFGAGASVEEAYQRYVEWLAEGIFDPDVGLFAPGSRGFLRSWPMTVAYFDYILFKEVGNLVEIVEAGDRALVYATNDPFSEPLFMVRSQEGWQIDLEAGVAEILDIAGGPYSWSFRDPQGSHTRPFADQLVMVDGLLRLRGGDNRAMRTFDRPTRDPSG